MSEKNLITCPGCGGDGRFLSECCNGSGGCSCHGEVVDLGECRVCAGSGRVDPDNHDRRANRRAIEGLHFGARPPSPARRPGRTIRTLGTGQPFDEEPGVYVGTYQTGPLVFHVFDGGPVT